MRTTIELTSKQSAKITELWKGCEWGGAMIGQPVARDGRYILRLRTATAAQAAKLNAFLSRLFAEENKQ